MRFVYSYIVDLLVLDGIHTSGRYRECLDGPLMEYVQRDGLDVIYFMTVLTSDQLVRW